MTQSSASLRASAEAPDLLGLYLRELGGTEIMSKEEELAAAQRIVGLRIMFWRALLVEPTIAGAIARLAGEVLPAETRPDAQLRGLLRAARGVLRRASEANNLSFEAAAREAAEALAWGDLDGVVSDPALADLVGAEQGKPCASLRIESPPLAGAAFVRYLAGVRRAHQAVVSAKQAFVRANLRLVVAIARRIRRGSMSLQDMIQEGNLGLIKAVDRFDPRRGFRFSTYGTWWIRHTISRAIADRGRIVRLPVHLGDTAGRLARAGSEFATLNGRAPTDEELVARTGVSAERIERVRRTWIEAPVSLEQQLPEHGGLTLADAIPDDEAPIPGQALDDLRLRAHLDEVMTLLAPMEAEILRLRLGDDDTPGRTLQEIGERYALSRERIRQLQEKAIGKLRGGFRRLALLDGQDAGATRERAAASLAAD